MEYKEGCAVVYCGQVVARVVSSAQLLLVEKYTPCNIFLSRARTPLQRLTTCAMAELPARRRLAQQTRRVSAPNETVDNAASAQTGDHMPQPGPAGNSWKSFAHDTAAGRLLSQIYGGKRKVKVEVPKPKTKPMGNRQGFVPGGASLSARDPREQHIVDANILIPDVGRRKYKPPAPIDR